MPLFEVHEGKAQLVKQSVFKVEKELQKFVENNITAIFNCRFVASEFSTGSEHGGRIDTLALSEDNSPVIIEYKNIESSDLINQSLFYLSWIKDHRGDFEIAVQKSACEGVEIDWSEIRVICIAPGFRKYDLHAVKMMGANIELWQFRLYENGSISFEEVFRKSHVDGPKIAMAEKTSSRGAEIDTDGTYKLEDHVDLLRPDLKGCFTEIRDFTLNLDESVEETPKKFYIAYKLNQNFVCIQTQKDKIKLFLKLDPAAEELPPQGRDVSNIGHYGTGNLELTVSSSEDIEIAKKFIEKSFREIGG